MRELIGKGKCPRYKPQDNIFSKTCGGCDWVDCRERMVEYIAKVEYTPTKAKKKGAKKCLL
jgi:hypothetical protein